MSLTERLSKLTGPPAAVTPKAPPRPALTPRLAEMQGAPAAVGVKTAERAALTPRLAKMGGVPAAVGVELRTRTRLTPRLAEMTGQPAAVGVSPRGRVSLSERLASIAGPAAPVGVRSPERSGLAARLEGIGQLPAQPAPSVPATPKPGLHARMAEVYDILKLTSPEWATIPFGDWMPDLPDLANPGATVAKNVIPAERSYRPLGALQAATGALDSAALGIVIGRDSSGNHYNYAGDAGKLYEVRASGITDKSKGGGYSTGSGDVWEFVLFGSRLLGTNFTDPVQGIDVGAAGLFADQITSTLKPKFRHLAVVREFLVGGNSNDASDGDVPHRTWWSGYRDPLDFDPDAQTQCDFEDRPGAGWVQRIIGGLEYGLVIQERGITRMTYSGGDSIFQFDSIDRKRGTPIPNSVIGHGRLVYFISEEGFFVTDGTQSYPIGANQVDKTFWAQFDVNNAALVSAAIDPVNKLVAWAFPGAGGITKIYFHDWQDRRWSEAEVDLEILVNATSEGFTLEDLDAVALDAAADTTISINEASGQTVISVTSVSGFSANDTVRITLNDASIHQTTVASVGVGEITIDDALPSAADAGERFVRTTIDVLTPGLDSFQWKGGGLNFGAFDTSHKLAYFDGANLAATIETGEHELNPSQLSKVTKGRALIDGGTITAAVAGRNRLVDAVAYDGSVALDDIGELGFLNESRYHRFRASIAAGGTWQHAQAMQVQASAMGSR